MDDDGMEYPDEDLDLMIDEELEIERELELERQMVEQREKENRGPSPPALSKASASPRALRVTDSNVGLYNNVDLGVKRTRSQGEQDDEDFPPMGSTSPAFKRFKGPTSPSAEERRIRLPRVGERKVLRRLPEGEFQAVTAGDGTRFYLRMADTVNKLRGTAQQLRGSTPTGRPVGLCGQPFHQLRSDATVEMTRLATAAVMREGLEDEVDDQQTELWVEKFKPKSYTELLSDNGTNRTLLMWLKLWDKLVYGRERKVKKPLTEQEQEKAKFKTGPQLAEVIEEWDVEGRPQQRVALLHGPPGLGKTTLAHIVARHAGYKVVEINASDDRSVEAFKKSLEAATQMRSVMGEERRPNCLVIDEIDGAPAATINLLVAALTGTGKSKKKNSGGKNLILRPVIAICNDLFTPSLRPLRNLALVLPFPPTLSTRLADRLREITAVEKLKTDLSALLALCKKTDNDIRSCLSTLQFFRKKGHQLRASDVASVSVGSKDSNKSLFSVWESLFAIPRAEKLNVDSVGGGELANTIPSRYKTILGMLYACGEYDRLVQGVFENYLAMKFKDAGMQGVVSGLEWMVHFDLLHQEAIKSQAWALMGHFCFPLVATHLLFASTTKQRIQFPVQQNEVTTRLSRSQQMIESVTGEMEPTARAYCSSATLLRDILPTILSVIQPTLRPVNKQLFSTKEKQELANVVAVHIAYNITYQQERNMETGAYDYRMDPDVEGVVCFPNTRRLTSLSYGTKQLISHEIELERMRRIDAANAAFSSKEGSRGGTPSKTSKGEGFSNATKVTPLGAKKTMNHLATLSAKPVQLKTVQPTDFFGRAIKVDPSKQAKNIESELVSSDIWFKFKEGYSNAVRRTIKMKDFL